jgi:hypothetical protein
MSTARPERPEKARPLTAPDIAQQSRRQYATVHSTVHSCNRLGRIGNLPTVGLGDWLRPVSLGDWLRRRAKRRG